MCICAEVSFGLAAALVPAGIYCVNCVSTKNPRLLPIAIIPIFFGVQQISEGLIWTGLRTYDTQLVTISGLVFLFFALVFWPFWIPFCAYFNQRDKQIRRIQAAITAFGLALGLVVYIPLLNDFVSPVAEVQHHSIHYNVQNTTTFQYVPKLIWELFYVAVVASPLIFSPTRKFVFLGVASCYRRRLVLLSFGMLSLRFGVWWRLSSPFTFALSCPLSRRSQCLWRKPRSAKSRRRPDGFYYLSA